MSMGPSYPNEVSDLLTGATYAIQHAVTVTRPDPSRAEMATRFMAAAIGRKEIKMESIEDFKEEMETMAYLAIVATDALIAALARKEKP